MKLAVSNTSNLLAKALKDYLKINCHEVVEYSSASSYDVFVNIHDGLTTCLTIDDAICKCCRLFVDVLFVDKESNGQGLFNGQFAKAKQTGIKYIGIYLYPLISERLEENTWITNCLDRLLKDETLDLEDCNQPYCYLFVNDAVRYICELCDYAMRSHDFSCDIYDVSSADIRPKKRFVETMKALTHSTSKLNYGVVESPSISFDLPNINKLRKICNNVSEQSFENTIEKLIVAIENRKPDIFEKIDNFKTFADVNSELLYGDKSKCSHPLISVVMPVYKRPELFEKSLQSVLNQDCDFEYEIVVVDNNDDEGKSPNQTIVEKAGSSKVFYYRHEKNIGGYGNFNRGVELSRAEYVSFCHDDDMFLPHALRVLWNLHLKNGVKCITSQFCFMEEDGTVPKSVSFPKTHFHSLIKEKASNRVSLFDQFIYATGLDICNLYNRSIFMELGGYNPIHHPSCDNALLASYTYYYGSVKNNIPSFLYRTGENASQTLWPLFADNHLHQRKCMAKKLPYPSFILKKIYMANYHMNNVQHRVFWNHEPKSLYLSVPVFERFIIKFLKKILLIKQYIPNISFFIKDEIRIYISANTKF